MEDKNFWRWMLLVVLGVLALSAYMIVPPSQQLRPGLDLGGGTRLVYEVSVPSGRDAETVVKQVIDVLKNRVDPDGVKNLVWVPLAGNRFEVQMPAPPPLAKGLREAYIKAWNELEQANLSRAQVQRALNLPDEQRKAAFDQLANGNDLQRQHLDALARASDALNQAQGPYDAAFQARIDAQKDYDQLLTQDASEAQREKARQQIEKLLDDEQAKSMAFENARQRLDQAWDKLLRTNVDMIELEAALTLSDAKRRDQAPSLRDEALAKLAIEYPQRADSIQKVAAAWKAYENVKGKLDDPQDLIDLLRGQGVLEFRIAPRPDDVPNLAQYRTDLDERGVLGGSGKPYRWFLIPDTTSFADTASAQQRLAANPQAYFAQRGLVGEKRGDAYYMLLSNRPEEVINSEDPNWRLTRAMRTQDQSGFPAVSFELNTVGGDYMYALTSAHQNEPMAIVLDGKVVSAPNINSAISTSGIITGGRSGFTPRELEYLTNTLAAGSLEGTVSEEPISQTTISPTFGQSNLQHGAAAALWALIAVAGFMAIYYLFAGVVADFALFANLVIILGVMAMIEATFTLPGIAGIVLTVGMAVDANVLIFERIREELDAKQDLKTAVRLGFGKALSTIIDANLTTMITCIVLYYTATAEIRGFALTLMLGIAATMFTALLSTRVMIELYIQFFKPKSLAMLPNLIPALGRLLRPNIPWVKLRPALITLSGAAMILSVIMVYERGDNMLDIEFRSGTQVTFELAKGKTLTEAQVNERLDAAAAKFNLPELASNRANMVMIGNQVGREFKVATLESDRNKVRDAMRSTFEDVLDVQPTVRFDRMDATDLRDAPIVPLTRARLAENFADARYQSMGLNRLLAQNTADVSDFIGGVAIVLDNLDTPITLDQARQRIDNVRTLPQYLGHGFRRYKVIGLEQAHHAAAAQEVDDNQTRFVSMVIVGTDGVTNYAQDSDNFDRAGADSLAAVSWEVVKDAMARESSLGSINNFSPQISGTMKLRAIQAIILSLLAVVIYIWFRFGSLRYSLAAIAALVHDVIISLGIVAGSYYLYHTALGDALEVTIFKIDLALVAAVLTIVGYSLNDTIVVFDRIRENKGRLPMPTPRIVDDSINQTISRTTLTSFTTLLALFTLYTLGGDGVHGFAFMMMVGVFVGTYSSIAIAAPIVLMGQKHTGAVTAPSPATAST